MIIVLHYRDLRVHDNPALHYAVESGLPVLPLYIDSENTRTSWGMGGCTRWWLHHSLLELQERYESLGAELVLRQGSLDTVIDELAASHDVKAVVWNRNPEPSRVAQEKKLQTLCNKKGIDVQVFDGNYLLPPDVLVTGQGKPYTVFTPFWKSLLKEFELERPLDRPKAIPYPKGKISTLSLDELSLDPQHPWKEKIAKHWKPGRKDAVRRLKAFVDGPIADYGSMRDFPAESGVSRMSPHLHFGEVSPREIWAMVKKFRTNDYSVCEQGYLRQLVWREFSAYCLYHFPKLPDHPYREQFADFQWDDSPDKLKLWQKGMTGYPIVDAAMRELWQTGWMHNRTRMIVGSFLTKDLFIPWQEGAKWFWDTLVDADLSNNSSSWQWVSGCGFDAAPYFRIFNPITQSEKFDPEGRYIRQYVPELKDLPNKWVHRPWEAPQEILDDAGVVIGETYPAPVVDHSKAREEALKRWEKIK